MLLKYIFKVISDKIIQKEEEEEKNLTRKKSKGDYPFFKFYVLLILWKILTLNFPRVGLSPLLSFLVQYFFSYSSFLNYFTGNNFKNIFKQN